MAKLRKYCNKGNYGTYGKNIMQLLQDARETYLKRKISSMVKFWPTVASMHLSKFIAITAKINKICKISTTSLYYSTINVFVTYNMFKVYQLV